MAAVASSVIAASVAIASAGAGMVMSFDAASKAKKKEARALAEVKNKMSEARRKLETNYMDVLSINKEPFERQREALLSAGAQALEAGIESERGGAATAGRLLAAQTEAQGQVRDAQSDRLFDLEAAQAEEDSRLRDIGVQLDLGEVAGAQEAASNAADKAAMMTNQGLQGMVDTVGAIGAAAPLYAKSAGGRQANVVNRNQTTSATNDKINLLSTQGAADFTATPQVGYQKGDIMTPQVGVKGDEGFAPAVKRADTSSDFAAATNVYDGVDITEIMNNPTEKQFNAFMSKQSGKWARDFRRNQLGVNTRAGQAIDFLNPFN
jgi:hypothetical protein